MLLNTLLLILQVLALLGYCRLICFGILGVKIASLELQILLGMGALGLISQLVSLFTGFHLWIQCAVYVVGFFPWCIDSFRSQIRADLDRILDQPKWNKIAFGSLAVLAIVLMSGPIMRDDTESYHLQSIKWMHEYGTVPGIANLHVRLGFNSSWLSLVSILTPKTNLNLYTTCNAILSLTLASALLFTPTQGLKKKQIISNRIGGGITLIFLLSIWYYWRGNIQSTNYDYYFLAICIVLAAQRNNGVLNDHGLSILLLILPAILFCVRPLYAPFLILSLHKAARLAANGQWSLVLKTAALGGAGIFFFLYRNIILSGYVLFPSLSLDFFDVKWKMPGEYVLIQWTYINNYVWDRSLPAIDGFTHWFKELYVYDKVVVILGSTLLINELAKRKWTHDNVAFTISVLLMFTFWLSLSPEPRFIAGIFFVGIFFGAMNFAAWIQKTSLVRYGLTAPTLVIFATSMILVTKKATAEKNLFLNIFAPYRLQKPRLSKVSGSGFEFYIPDKLPYNWNRRCFLSPIPCVYDSLPGVRMIGNDIKYGFYIHYAAPRNISEN